MKITMLGTGNAGVVDIYNTCYVIEDEGRYLLVDGGGGNRLFHQLKSAGISINDIHDVFVTHKHLDHMFGIIWLIRMICQNMTNGVYEGDAYIFTHREVIELVQDMCMKLIRAKDNCHIGERVHLVEVTDGAAFEAAGFKCTAFDIKSTKAAQFGFAMEYGDGKRFVTLGDEPYYDSSRKYVEGCDFLMHEAFCLYSEADIYEPYEKHHSTVKDACELAERLGVKTLLLYHSVENDYETRKERFVAEGRPYFSGELLVPDDLEVIEL